MAGALTTHYEQFYFHELTPATPGSSTPPMPDETGKRFSGFLHQPEGHSTAAYAIYVHGLAGDAHGHSLVGALAAEFAERNIAMLTFNNSGAGNKFSFGPVVCGSEREDFDRSPGDIYAAMHALAVQAPTEAEETPVYVVGHSLGGIKALHFASKPKGLSLQVGDRTTTVRGVAALDSPDMPDFMALGKDYRSLAAEAALLMASGQGDEPFVSGFGPYQLSFTPRAFLSLSQEGGAVDVYPRLSLPAWLGGPAVSAFLAYGREFPLDLAQAREATAVNSALTVVSYPEANHNFNECLPEVVAAVGRHATAALFSDR